MQRCQDPLRYQQTSNIVYYSTERYENQQYHCIQYFLPLSDPLSNSSIVVGNRTRTCIRQINTPVICFSKENKNKLNVIKHTCNLRSGGRRIRSSRFQLYKKLQANLGQKGLCLKNKMMLQQGPGNGSAHRGTCNLREPR